MRAGTFAASVVVLTVSFGGCTAAHDPTPEAERALKGAQLEEVTVDWDEDAQIAHLKGTVDSADRRERAEQLAASAVGTAGRVLNEVTIRGINDETADDLDGRIRSTLKKTIEKDAVLKDRDINFEVTNGMVTVKGDVRTAAEKAKVSELVRAAPGVKDMANALDIKSED